MSRKLQEELEIERWKGSLAKKQFKSKQLINQAV
jgi:hypothetical protein